MSTNNRDIEINPLSQLYDELRLLLNGLVVKFASEADKYETFENRKYSDQYLSALNKTDSFGLYDFTSEEYRKAGIDNDEVILRYQKREIEHPPILEERLLLLRRNYVIENYEEPNDYYRKLNGLPPIKTIGGSIVTKIMQNSLEVVSNTDSRLDDFTLHKISEHAAYQIMGNNFYHAGDHIHISSGQIQDEKTSMRCFLITPDDYPVDHTMKVLHLKDVQNIFDILTEGTNIPGNDVIGMYFHADLSDVMDTSTYFKESYLVVSDDEINYDYTTMIKLTEAKMNNKLVTIGDNLLLGDYHYVTKEIMDLYGISIKVPIHKISDYYGENFIYILESSGFIDNMIKAFPKDEYLHHLGTKRIPIVTARQARNFDLLHLPDCKREIIHWVFANSYNAAREYFVSTVYNYYYRQVYDYYDNFIGISICQMAITQTIARAMQTAIERDFYDETLVRWLFEMYGVPYYPNLPYQTQRRLVKNLNHLIQYKATSHVIFDIASILGYHDISIFKYYLVKERNFDSEGNLIYKDKMVTEPYLDVDGHIKDAEIIVNDLERMYDVYFQKVDIEEINFQNALTDLTRRVGYDSVTLDDPLWWDDSDTFVEVYGDHTKYTADTEVSEYHRHYNYMETKYIGITISYKMSEVLYENIMLLRMIFDKKDELSDIYITLPKITGSMKINIFDIIVYLCALISKQNHLTGEILTRYSSIMDVMGYITEDYDGYRPCDTLAFNFDLLTNAETYKEIIKNPSRYVRPHEREQFEKYLSVLTLNQSTVKEKIDAINDMYQNIKGLGYFIGRKMSESDNLFEYRAWKDFYDALFIGHENAEMFALGSTGRVAKTYLEYLSIMNPALYNTMTGNVDETHIYTYIDHTIARLETVIHDLKTLYIVNDSNSSILNYLVKLVRFFKSYTTDLLDVTTEYIFDMRPDNLFKLVEYYKIHHVIGPKDTMNLMYSDVMKIFERIKEIDPLRYQEMIRLIHTEATYMDVMGISNINCNNCPNINQCRAYCPNNKSTCNGTYRVGTEWLPCSHYGYDTTGFLEFVNTYKTLLRAIDTKGNYDLEVAIATHIAKALNICRKVSEFNVFYGSRNFNPDHMIESLYESLDHINDLLDKYEYTTEINETGVDGIKTWVTLLMSTDSEIPKLCRNVNFPCKDPGLCNFNKEKETLHYEETYTERDKAPVNDKWDFYHTLYVDYENPLFTESKIHKIEDHHLLDGGNLPLVMNNKYEDTRKIKDDSHTMSDYLSKGEKVLLINDRLGLKDSINIYEE